MSRFELDDIQRYDEEWRSQFVADATSLGFFRILFVLYLAFSRCLEYRWIGGLPDAFFVPHPLTLTAFGDAFPSHAALSLLDCGIGATLAAVLVGLQTRSATALLLLLSIIGDSYRYSFGKIDHHVLTQAVLLVMLWADWGRALSFDAHLARRSKVNERPGSLRGLALMIALGFASAGIPKALVWVDFDLGTVGVLSWLYDGYYGLDRTYLLADWAIRLRPLWLWEFADLGTVALELGFLVAMFKRRWMFAWLALASVFHLGICLILNIPFEIQAICYLAFVPWARFIPNPQAFERYTRRALLGLAVVVLVLPWIVVPSAPNAQLSLTSLLMTSALWLGVGGLFFYLAWPTPECSPENGSARGPSVWRRTVSRQL
jgi:hypothetical protein